MQEPKNNKHTYIGIFNSAKELRATPIKHSGDLLALVKIRGGGAAEYKYDYLTKKWSKVVRPKIKKTNTIFEGMSQFFVEENIPDPKSKKIEILGKIKIARKFAMLIQMGFKTVEVRKVEKGYVEGYYMLVDVETGEDLFVIYMKPHALNPRWSKYDSGAYGYSTDKYAYTSIDKMTWKWVKKNYVRKKIDFIVYKISIPEEKND